MSAEIGNFILIFAFVLSLIQSGLFLCRKFTGNASVATTISGLLLGCVGAAFLILINAFVESDFSVAMVIENSHSAKPLIYKITGTWGNHEGSMLLWVLVLAAFSYLFALKSRSLESRLYITSLSIQGIVTAGFLLFIILTSNPFARAYPYPFEGKDLNPLLQDIGLALHPPMLYVGYVGFSIVFSMAVAALLVGRMDASWANHSRKWIMLSWSFLTAGIGLGGWWAYRELGWGGWWFWDPVENASLLPWLAGTALLHSNMVVEKRGQLKRWTLLLALITFTLSVTGTFLVRSGIITSVHSFAADPERGLFILTYLAVISGGAFLIYATRSPLISTQESLVLGSKEGAIVINSLFLTAACLTVLLATVYPLILQLMGENSVSIGPPYFNNTFVPLVIPLLVLAGMGGFIPWKTLQLRGLMKTLSPSIILAVLTAAITLFTQRKHPALSALGIGLGVWLISSSLHYLYLRIRPLNTISRLFSLPSSALSMVVAHLGLGVLVLGVTGSALWQEEIETLITTDTPVKIAQFKLTLKNEEDTKQQNFVSKTSTLLVNNRDSGDEVTTLTPQMRYYPVRAMTTSESSIYAHPLYDLYAVTAQTHDKKTSLRLYYTPMMLFLWAGFALMAFGGMVAVIKPQKDSLNT